jgi:hypothetical protein
MKGSLTYVVTGVLSIIVLLILCMIAQITIGNDITYAVTVVGAGLIVLSICIITTHESGITWITSPEHIRAKIAVSIVVEYMVMVGIVAFFHGWGNDPVPQVTQTLITNFTSIVGVVIAFFFGTSAYIERRDNSRKTNPAEGSEFPVGTLVSERPPDSSERAQFGHSAPTSGV